MNGNLIIGNACTLLAMATNAASSTKKTVKGVLAVQSLGQVIYCISAVVLGGYSAAVQNVVSIFRNFVAIRNIKSKALEWSLVAAGVVLGVAFNNRGLLGLLPVIATLEYTLAIFRFRENERLLKVAFLLSSVAFAVFNVVIYNIVGAASDTAVAVTTAVVLCKGAGKKGEEKSNTALE